MLIRFGVKNHLSIKDYQELNLVASSLTDEPKFVLRSAGIRGSLLPCAAIYGANASGKTNVLQSLNFMRNTVRHSHANLKPGDRLPRHPFLLESGWQEQPSEFDCDFVVGGSRFKYGFSLDDSKVLSEYLYAYPSGYRQIWYERDATQSDQFYFGKYLKGRNRLISELTRSNSLFLSAAAQQNHEQVDPIYRFFSDGIVPQLSRSVPHESAIAESLEQKELRDRVAHFLRYADVGIEGIDIEEAQVPDEVRNFVERFMTTAVEFRKDGKQAELFDPREFRPKEIKMLHRSDGDHSVSINFDSESAGTVRLLQLIRGIFRVLDSGGVLLLDEIDASLHTLLAMKVIALFVSPETNRRNAQIIFSTHDTNLLCSGLLRRDEIWFTEKSKNGATHLYPLSDIRTRKTDNLEKGYLQGRFGAIPFLGDTKMLIG